MTEALTDAQPWLSLTEAAEQTGLDREAIRSRARRGFIPSRKGNRGQLLVQVSADLLTAPDRDDDRPLADHGEAIADLQAEVTEVRLLLARAEADRDAAKAIAAAEVAAKDALIVELRTMLADARRPWWFRVFGVRGVSRD